MATMWIYVDAWSILPSGSTADVGYGGASGSVEHESESTGRFGSALVTIKNGIKAAKEYEFLDTSFRGSSFRMRTSIRDLEIPDNDILDDLANFNYIVRLKILALSQSVGSVEFDVREINHGRVYGPVHVRHARLSNTTGTYFELFGGCRENKALIDTRRALY